ncbi:MAG TPA: AAA family ATPase [Candidatus Saccharimonadales bacterium]|nr:AAA family ATPase [Candidatus Saccharimonadales bacterium]
MDKKVSIIGLSGTNGSGKDTVGQMLADKHNYLFISVTELLRAEAKRRGLPIQRENLRQISAEWRREFGLGVLVDKAVAEYRKKPDQYSGVVMASLRNPGEADRIHKLGGTMVWIDADPRVRYERIQANAHRRGRRSEDDKTFEEFMTEEAAEMQHDGDSATLNMLGVKEKSDVFVQNDTSDLEAFGKQIDQVLGL